MLLDAQKGQPIELEVTIGEVVRMAKSVGAEIPVSKTNLVLLLYAHVVIYSVQKLFMLFCLSFKTKYCVN